MKKITLLTFILGGLLCSTATMSQTLNQNANWPNPAWEVTGTYNDDPDALESDPTVSANFAFDDDDAGQNHEDNIAAESPVIDLTAASTAGETLISVSVDYVYNWLAATEKLALQYYDADAASWVDWQTFAPVDTAGAPNDNFCTGTPENFISEVLDIAGFTATQLTGFRYRLFFDDNVDGIGWIWGFCFQSPTIMSLSSGATTLDYYNLQWPPTGTIVAGDTFDVYAQAYEAGLTDVTAGQSPGIAAWIGYNAADTNPSDAEWTWIPAIFNAEGGNNDEYTLNLGAQINSTGTFYYASRWQLNGGAFVYGGIQADGSYGGIWGDDNNISGVLTINPPTNDECADAIMLTVGTDLNCTNPVSGSTIGSTQSLAGCVGTANDDVWYAFVAIGSAHSIIINNTSGTTDIVTEVFDACGGASLICQDTPNSPIHLTGLTAGNTYYFRIYTYTSTDTSRTSFDVCVGTPPPPPANDECSGAIALTPGITYDVNPQDGTVVSATVNGETAGCGSNGPGVWYSVVVPADGNITIETGPDSGATTGFDSVIEAFSGTCGSLVSIECDDDDALTGSYSLLNLTGQAPGTTIYIRVWEYFGDETEPFSISAYSPTLSIDDVADRDSFTYFPNPVKNELKLTAQSNIQNVSIFNMLGQEVLKSAPNAITSDVDMSALQTGAYFVKVTINDVVETIRVIKQ